MTAAGSFLDHHETFTGQARWNQVMRRWFVVLAFLVTACSQAPDHPVANASSSPTQTVTSSPTPPPSPGPSTNPSPAPTPKADLPLTTLDFSCRLPVFRSASYTVFTGSFVTFPAATVATDLLGGLHRLPPENDLVTDASPTLHGGSDPLAPFYDRAQRRWVPAGSAQSAADGAFYAYALWDPANPSRAKVHVVDVARAAERVFDIAVPPDTMGLTVDDFDSAGVYLVGNRFEQLPDGVWLMDPKTGAIHQLSQATKVFAVRNGYAWSARIDPRDPSPPVLRRSGTAADSVVRVNLAGGSETVWFYRPGALVWLMGFDSQGVPIVNVADPSGTTDRSETWLAGAAGGPGLQIYAGDVFLSSPQGDGDRTWFGSYSGIYLYTRAQGLQKVVAFSDLIFGEAVTPAGVCS